MSHPLKHPKGVNLLKRVAHSFRSDSTYILPSSAIIFVCGGPLNEDSMRRRFSDYASSHLPELRLFHAEDVMEDYSSHDESDFQNVAEFEDIMASISSCVILFPESPGSHAELGYFSRHEELRKKLLVVNNASLQSADSFISLGPIALIDQNSDFRPSIQLSPDDPAFDLVKQRLQKRAIVKRKRRYLASTYKELSDQKVFYAVFDLIHIFRILTFEELEHAFRRIWKNASRTNLRRALSILVAANYVWRRGDDNNYFCKNPSMQPFLDLQDLDSDQVTMEALDLYEKSFPEVAGVLRGVKS